MFPRSSSSSSSSLVSTGSSSSSSSTPGSHSSSGSTIQEGGLTSTTTSSTSHSSLPSVPTSRTPEAKEFAGEIKGSHGDLRKLDEWYNDTALGNILDSNPLQPFLLQVVLNNNEGMYSFSHLLSCLYSDPIV